MQYINTIWGHVSMGPKCDGVARGLQPVAFQGTLADAATRRGLSGGADFSTDRTDAWIPMGHGCPAQLRTHDYTEMLPLSECYTLTCDIGSLFSSLVSTYCTVVVHVYF